MSDLRLLYRRTSLDDEQPVLLPCPFHADSTPSFAVYRHNAFCFGCRKWEGYWEHLRRVGVTDELPKAYEGTTQKRHSYSSADLSLMAERWASMLADKRLYLEGRGLSPSLIQEALLGYTGSSFSIPIFVKGEPIATIRFRRDDQHGLAPPKYWGLRGLNQSRLYAPKGLGAKLVWCEGEFDTLIACQAGALAATSTNGISQSLEQVREKLGGVEEVRIAVDQDEAGFRRGLELSRFWKGLGAATKVLRFGEKDLTDFFLRHGMERMRELCLGE